MIGMRKLYLTHFWPFLILLAILMKNHGILEILTKIRFHHIILNLTNTNPLTNWQVFISMSWTWRWMWHKFSILWFSSTFWIYADSDILTRFGPIPKPTLIPIPIELEHEPLILNSHIHCWEMNVNFNFMIWTKLMNQLWLSNLNLIWVLFLSQYRCLFFSLLSSNHPFHKTTCHCWTKI